MLDKRTAQMKVQELADCYKATDYLKEMCRIEEEGDPEEAALKWIALAVLHGVNANAESVSLRRHPDGQVTVLAQYRDTFLPSPGSGVGEKVIEAIRRITHFEKDKEKGPWAFGWGNESLELRVKVKRKDGQETVTIEFPK
ncbi:MAG: hypothetical protein Kow0092_35790 [Deferrisomatales bacterium]